MDGKNVATLGWHDLCKAVAMEPREVKLEEVRTRLNKLFPQVQFCVPEIGEPYGLVRTHTVTLISSNAGVCIHQRPIEGHTSEPGAMPSLLDELRGVYGRTRLFGMVTTDAGNTSLKVADQITANGWDYLCQIKSGHQELHFVATTEIGESPTEDAEWTEGDQQNGLAVSYHVFRYDLTEDGWMGWTHARQLVRVRRETYDSRTGEVTIGNRYHVTSRPPKLFPQKNVCRSPGITGDARTTPIGRRIPF